jgi:hypothetical protein
MSAQQPFVDEDDVRGLLDEAFAEGRAAKLPRRPARA